jgi:hypothetical protein
VGTGFTSICWNTCAGANAVGLAIAEMLFALGAAGGGAGAGGGLATKCARETTGAGLKGTGAVYSKHVVGDGGGNLQVGGTT